MSTTMAISTWLIPIGLMEQLLCCWVTGMGTSRFRRQHPYFHRFPEICDDRVGSVGNLMKNYSRITLPSGGNYFLLPYFGARLLIVIPEIGRASCRERV